MFRRWCPKLLLFGFYLYGLRFATLHALGMPLDGNFIRFAPLFLPRVLWLLPAVC